MAPLKVRAGDDFVLTLTWKNPNGTPINITGYTFAWHVAVGAITNDFTTSPEIVFSAPTTGVVVLKVPHTITSTYDTDHGRHWFVATSPSGEKTTLLIGDVDVVFNK